MSSRNRNAKKPIHLVKLEERERHAKEMQAIADARLDDLHRIQREMRDTVRFVFIIGMGVGALLVGSVWYGSQILFS